MSAYSYSCLQVSVLLAVVYFDQLSGARMLVEILFFSRFQPFLLISKLFSDFTAQINKVENG